MEHKVRFMVNMTIEGDDLESAMAAFDEEMYSTVKYLDKGGEDHLVCQVLCNLELVEDPV